MAIIFFLVFLLPYSLAVAAWGQWLRPFGGSPEWFLPLAFFLMGQRGRHPMLGLFILAIGIAADVTEGHPWAIQTIFLLLLFAIFCTRLFLVFLENLFGRLALLVFSTWLLLLWEQALLGMSGNAARCILATLLISPALWFAFKLLGIGWGLKYQDRLYG